MSEAQHHESEVPRSAHGGDADGQGALFASLYGELHRLAASQLRRNPAAGLGATTLLHEAYLDLSSRRPDFPDRAHFFGYAARAMRGLLIDYAREGRAMKRGGEYHLTALNTNVADSAACPPSMEALGNALAELEGVDRPLAELVDLKYFCGFSFADIAAQRGVSERTVQRDWQKARLFLRHALADE